MYIKPKKEFSERILSEVEIYKKEKTFKDWIWTLVYLIFIIVATYFFIAAIESESKWSEEQRELEVSYYQCLDYGMEDCSQYRWLN